MLKKCIVPTLAAAISTSAMAGMMGSHGVDNKLLFLEGGLTYSHSFYKGSIVPPESRTAIFPFGFAFDAKDHYPNNFWGGYFGLSTYASQWLLNSRVDIYASKSKTDGASGTSISFAPSRLSLTADRVWGDIRAFSFGVGAGAVIENLNKGHFLAGTEAGTEGSHSLAGRSRLDPLIEGFVMKALNECISVKLNVAYQIHAHNNTANGDLNVNLGLNYAFPV